ncbi:hypothetical protein [Solimonas soli]|uniref:hypothetical protein n=1 Tax=Solimonas soli TaxID=413479 RepID=UPI00047F1880|nr:hypothetical protein [Solimonas soli]
MEPIKQLLAAFVRRPSEQWRFIRQAVHEIHFVLQGAAQLTAEIEARLARLEAEAARQGTPAAVGTPRPRRRPPRGRGAARRANRRP